MIEVLQKTFSEKAPQSSAGQNIIELLSLEEMGYLAIQPRLRISKARKVEYQHAPLKIENRTKKKACDEANKRNPHANVRPMDLTGVLCLACAYGAPRTHRMDDKRLAQDELDMEQAGVSRYDSDCEEVSYTKGCGKGRRSGRRCMTEEKYYNGNATCHIIDSNKNFGQNIVVECIPKESFTHVYIN
eukprot:6267704-Amphidinium_carterae.1